MLTGTSPPKRGRKPKQAASVEPMQTTEQIVRIPLTELHPFPDHPYGIREDQAMQDTVDSVKQNGVVVPAIVRPRAEGGYEIVAGHRRKLASEQAGFTDMPCIVRNITDVEAIIQLVDSNAQREDVLPSERAKAYKMRLEAIKRTAGSPRKDLSENAPNNSANYRSDDEVGSVDGISGDTVRNIISLTNLVPELMQMVDDKKISLTPAYQIANLTEPEQRLLLDTMEGLPMPAAIWCASPVDDIRFDQQEVFLRDMFCASNGDTLEAYVGDADPTDPRISPIYGDFSDFPPSFIQTGSRESLAAGALRVVDKLVRAGNEVHFTFGKGMPHTFAMDYAIYPEAENAMNEILTFMNNVLDLA